MVESGRGGLELLFGNTKSFDVTIVIGEEVFNMKSLLRWIRTNLLQERPELFLAEGDSLCVPTAARFVVSSSPWPSRGGRRPGILCLINGADWELEGTLDYEPHSGDTIEFISTLHGG